MGEIIENKDTAAGQLSGKVALVTGASRGIGRAIALALAGQGAAVLVNYNGSRERALDVVAEIENNGGQAEAVGCDVADFAACGKLVEEVIAKYGHVDILVNNAGVTRDNLILRMTEEEYDKVLDTNLKGAFNTIRHLSRYFLKQRGGKVINISSVSGVMGNAGQSNYSASKAGLIGLTKSVARELAGKGICVNAVAPGYIATDMTEALPEKAREGLLQMIPMGKIGQPEDIAQMVVFLAGKGICVNAVAPGYIATDMTEALSEKAREGLLQMIPMGRIGRPEDIAQMVVFLAGPGSDYITGQVIHVDGGMAM